MSSLLRLSVLAAVAPIGIEALFLGGGLTILSRNKLDGAQNDGTAAILVSQPSPFSAAKTACALLGEVPWDPDAASFTAALNASLAYQVYQGIASADQLYWVAKADDEGDSCRGMDATGAEYDVDCLTKNPVLCTQSAPVSTSSFANNSLSWQVSHFVGNKQLAGYRDYHTWKFRGLAYAEPPERFGYSKVASFDDAGEVDAINAGPDCTQPVGEVKNTSLMSENCLFINVWTPYLPRTGGDKAKAHLKPVMLYLYGGGLTSGSGRNPNTDGTNLASRGDVVVVSANYRVGSLGFLNLDDGVHRGNYAVSDMVAALEWVHKYIADLGGDPSRVTLFGESAGAQSTHVLLGVPKAQGLFHRAIMQSSPDGYPSGGKVLQYGSYDSLEHNFATTTRRVLRDAGCANATDAVACLGRLSGYDLVNLTTNANGIVADGTYLLNHELVVNDTSASVATGVAMMVGFNRDETGVLVDNYPSNGTSLAAYFDAEVARHFSMPANASAILGLPGSNTTATSSSAASFLGATAPNTPAAIFDAAMRIGTAAVFNCYGLAVAWSGAKHRAFASSYVYQFNRTYQTTGYTRPWCVPPAGGSGPEQDEYKKCHAGEQMVVFGTVARAGHSDRDGRDFPFMGLVVDHWAAFARAADPNPDTAALVARGHWDSLARLAAPGVGRWEPVDPAAPTLRLLQWESRQIPFVDQDVCKALGAAMDVFG
ncbi:Alpha/Beta hydrolase protein [Lasiosphaeria miniovina]|uniref:Alpha/Beta hydrolase protein n=1 Tax=Lasiosphaeria miniovina TaxID=1954250 RepID=A0AA40E2I6_9PEZI|nr:Alpha/Beta hydrolase protein [Lasiosphaeria miniovina]KAK0721821.1 Alpha/Beta hydrolase protein [Lasiosphaeria miniovina]